MGHKACVGRVYTSEVLHVYGEKSSHSVFLITLNFLPVWTSFLAFSFRACVLFVFGRRSPERLDEVSPMPPYSKKKQFTRLNSVKIIINNSHVMHYMPFWITYKTCNNTPDFREEEKKKGKKKSLTFRRMASVSKRN